MRGGGGDCYSLEADSLRDFWEIRNQLYFFPEEKCIFQTMEFWTNGKSIKSKTEIKEMIFKYIPKEVRFEWIFFVKQRFSGLLHFKIINRPGPFLFLIELLNILSNSTKVKFPCKYFFQGTVEYLKIYFPNFSIQVLHMRMRYFRCLVFRMYWLLQFLKMGKISGIGRSDGWIWLSKEEVRVYKPNSMCAICKLQNTYNFGRRRKCLTL